MPFPILPSNSASGYFLTKSLRFRSSASAYLNRTPASAGNRQIWTYSFWCKKPVIQGSGGTYCYPLTAGTATGGNSYAGLQFYQDTLVVFDQVGGGANNIVLQTTQVFRDPSAWYHFVVAVDTTQATSTNRVKVYVNGTQITAFGTAIYPSQNYSGAVNNTVNHGIDAQWQGSWSVGTDLYLAEVNLVDGQALTPSSFGSTNSLTGVWQPAKYTGTYGTNGFYLPFTNTTSTTTLGYDFSGNSNNWTTNNLSLTAGSTYDSMTDVPTLTDATTANYPTANPLDNGGLTITNGNLNLTGIASVWRMCRATQFLPTGKWYWETTITALALEDTIINGVAANSESLTASVGDAGNANAAGIQYGTTSGLVQLYGSTRVSSTLSGQGDLAANDVLGFAYDVSTGRLWMARNNTWLNSGSPSGNTGYLFTGITASVAPAFSNIFTGNSQAINFGQQGFNYTPPTGYLALNTYNLPTSTIVKGNTVMDATTFTATGTTQTVTNTAGFKPDLVWQKARNQAYDHLLGDSVRGVANQLSSNTTGAEVSYPNFLTSLNSNGFSLGTTNTPNGTTMVGWQWQAGQGSSSSNTSGSITSTVSVNATAGFSVVTWTGAGSTGTVGHGLGVAPSMIIAKRRNTTTNWQVYHSSLGATNQVCLNLTNASFSTTTWNNTTPTSSVFSVDNVELGANGGTYVAYCWSQIAGFSSFGSYTGNGSTNGTFVYTGFRPKFVLTKSIGVAHDWNIWDSSRSPYNAAGLLLQPNSSGAEQSPYNVDLLSNGFKFYDSNATWNGSGETYIYMAFAENPFKNALAR
jgi:hypothetical protein